MKIRTDFVTNSSSSSFIISKKYLDEDQIEAIRCHGELGEKLGLSCCSDTWDISENENYITGYTWMDNFSMYDFLEEIEVDTNNCVRWSEYPFSLDWYSSNEIDYKYKEEKTWRDYLREISY